MRPGHPSHTGPSSSAVRCTLALDKPLVNSRATDAMCARLEGPADALLACTVTQARSRTRRSAELAAGVRDGTGDLPGGSAVAEFCRTGDALVSAMGWVKSVRRQAKPRPAAVAAHNEPSLAARLSRWSDVSSSRTIWECCLARSVHNLGE